MPTTTVSSTLTVNVAAVNDAPVDADETLTATENTAFTPVDLLANASDVEGDTLTLTVNSITGNTLTGSAVSVTNGTLSVATGSLDSLAAGTSETVTVNYTVSDGHGGSNTSTATVTITGANDAPVLGATTVSAAATALATVGGSQIVSGTNVPGPQMNAAAGSTTYPTHTALSLVAVDNTSAVTQGQTVDVTTRGGTTAYSTSVATMAAGTGPVVIDANHDGVISYGHAVLDVNGDGVLDSTAWAGKGDGVLLWNRYGDGQVHDASQYAFGQQFGGSDLQAVAKGFDRNQDGVLDAKDAAYGQFGVWQDSNSDGKVEAGEFKSLADSGIASLKLSSDGVQRTDQADVIESGRTTATTATGEALTVADVTFSYDTAASVMQNATTTQLAAGAHVQGLSGVDVFAWRLADPATDRPATISNFDLRATAAGGDVLDLRDLLTGETPIGTDPGNLANYLHFSATGGDTTIAIKSTGTEVTQNLVLKGVDLTALGNSDTAIIQDLLIKGKLVTD
jgi:hypothetical protein